MEVVHRRYRHGGQWDTFSSSPGSETDGRTAAPVRLHGHGAMFGSRTRYLPAKNRDFPLWEVLPSAHRRFVCPRDHATGVGCPDRFGAVRGDAGKSRSPSLVKERRVTASTKGRLLDGTGTQRIGK